VSHSIIIHNKNKRGLFFERSCIIVSFLLEAEILRGDGDGVKAARALSASQLHLARDWSGEHRLKQFLLRHYDRTTRPVRSDKTPVKVQISIALYHILDTVSFSHPVLESKCVTTRKRKNPVILIS